MDIKNITLATSNKNKKIEIKKFFENIDVNVLTLDNLPEIEETGKTFEENAIIKAQYVAKLANSPALADDSGLETDAIGGMPGVYSSRYAQNDKKRIKKLLDELKEVPYEKRTARFICSMVLVSQNKDIIHSCKGVCEGFITFEPRGSYGFGYDPVFFIPELNFTMAELTLDQKNTISHRGKALKCMKQWLEDNIK